MFLSMLSFLFFTDMGIYWIHRALHHKLLYKVRGGLAASGSQPPPCTRPLVVPLLPTHTSP